MTISGNPPSFQYDEPAKAPPDRERLANELDELRRYMMNIRLSICGKDADDTLREAAAALRLSPVTAGEWQDISTAPKDRRILLGKIGGHPSHPTSLWWACGGSWSARFNNWNDGVEPCGLAGPTHWAEFPLPPSPKEAGR